MTHRVMDVKAQIHNLIELIDHYPSICIEMQGLYGCRLEAREEFMETVLFFGGVVALQAVTDVPTGLRRWLPHLDWHQWRFRLQSWSMLAGLYALAMMLNNTFSVVLFSFVVYHLLKGFFSTVNVRIVDRLTLLLAFTLVPLQIVWLWAELPLIVFLGSLFIPLAHLALTARTRGWLESASKLIWATAGSSAFVGFLTMAVILPSAIHPVIAGLMMFAYALVFRYISMAVWHGR